MESGETGGFSEAFEVRGGRLLCEDCLVEDIAQSVPTPFYLYSLRCLKERFRRLDRAFSSVRHTICYALKANAQPELLRALVNEGAGAEVVSGAELALALRVGFPPERIVFSGVGKTPAELEAGVRSGILMFIVESEGEMVFLDRVAARLGRSARAAIRINPAIDAGTHPHITTGVETAKFGLDPDVALELYARGADFPHLELAGVHAHIGSQITSLQPLVECARLLSDLAQDLRSRGVRLTELDLGGGLGVPYGEESVPTLEEFARELLPCVSNFAGRILLEPGRSLVGPAGALVVGVLYRKKVHGRSFLVVDGGMNDFLRPALYDAYHRIVPLSRRDGDSAGETVDVVGAVCESSDVFGRSRWLGDVGPGDLLAVMDAGAYGYSMSSNYNLRPRPSEVVVEGRGFRVVREPETVEDLVARELGERSRYQAPARGASSQTGGGWRGGEGQLNDA